MVASAAFQLDVVPRVRATLGDSQDVPDRPASRLPALAFVLLGTASTDRAAGAIAPCQGISSDATLVLDTGTPCPLAVLATAIKATLAANLLSGGLDCAGAFHLSVLAR